MKTFKKRKYHIVILVAIIVTTGVFFLFERKRSNLKRNLASLEEQILNLKDVPYDLTEFQDLELINRMKFRLIETAEFLKDEKSGALSLGNMMFKKGFVSSQELCEEFSRIEMVLQASNLIVSGDLPGVKITTSCMATKQSPKLNSISIPLEVLQSGDTSGTPIRRGDTEFTLANFDDIRPSTWEVVEIRLVPEKGDDFFVVNGYEIARIRGEPLRFEF
jgi:hypothetical protein